MEIKQKGKDTKMSEKFYMYKGYPLVRKGDMIYYGYMSDPYVIMINILSKKMIGDTEVSDKVRVIQMSTDPSLDPLKACVKNAEREGGLYEALDLARVWLDKALKS